MTDPTAALRARLEAFVTERDDFRNNPSAWFEARAEEFYAETHLIAPGRSVPLAMGGQDEHERQTGWQAFLQRRAEAVDALLRDAAQALASHGERQLYVKCLQCEGNGFVTYGDEEEDNCDACHHGYVALPPPPTSRQE